MHDLGVMVLTPAGLSDPALAIAATRAGAIGVLNLEYSDGSDDVRAPLQALADFGRGRFGVLVDGRSAALLDTILGDPPAQLDTVVLTASAPELLPGLVARVHGAGRRALVVVTGQAEAAAGWASGADALIAKGHEAGGWVGDETTFVLLQRLLGASDRPVWAYGGIGLHSAAACRAAGADGVVLDSQLLLAREAPLSEEVRQRVAAMDGSETTTLGEALGATVRLYARPGSSALHELRRREIELVEVGGTPVERRAAWRDEVRRRVGWQSDASVVPLGQDAAMATPLARRHRTVGGIVAAFRASVAHHCAVAARGDVLVEGAPLARAHATRYPIVQGPMTRVSDRAEFAAAVAEGGGLPFLALSLLRAPEADALLGETASLLGDRPWGVGILGFVPPALRAEQLAVVQAHRPRFALMAGGRPDQARLLEEHGIPTYLHVPSPGLLALFLQDGARRFVFEGRECGGHVGPRTSFVLWDSMVEQLADHLGSGDGSDFQVLFAGGIHDGLSAAMVAALAAPLVERGVRIGVLLGTAYLFVEEAVRAGAITPGFQAAALACQQTVLLESGPGHATRCAPSAFVDEFAAERRSLLGNDLRADELRERLEQLNIGRLRIASKGLDRHPDYGRRPDAPRLAPVSEADQQARGMFMIGQVAALRDRTGTIADLHDEISVGGSRRLAALAPAPTPVPATADSAQRPPSAGVAIVGMGCIMPDAADLATFWANIVNKVDAVREVPPERWDWHQYFDADRAARDKVYSRSGGFIPEVPFDPVLFGMPPASLRSIEPFQLLALAVARAALDDAGYLDRPFPRERTAVVFGAGGGGGDLSAGYVTRSSLPSLFGEDAAGLVEHLGGALPEWTEDSFAGILMNVAAGRIANRLDLGGANFTVDAACASSLAAIYLAARELEARTSDVVIAGGVDAIQGPFAYLCFSKTQALSPTGRCRPFDAAADGIAISEGFAAVVLKRLDDAERDGDRIYAVIRGVGSSSDGRDRSLTAPRPEGQIRALERAYAQADVSPATVGLVEAHGTGTVAGDRAEVQALSTFFRRADAARQGCAIGSVKSMIGHTKATAGVAGLVKVALALHQRVLPPTLGVTRPSPSADFPSSPFYVNTETRPWVHAHRDRPRRAGVSAFGFGGTNYHAVLEEYAGDYLPEARAAIDPWPAELFAWRADSPDEIAAAVEQLSAELAAGGRPRLADLAYTLTTAAMATGGEGPTLAIVATSLDDLAAKLATARKLLADAPSRCLLPNGIAYVAARFPAGSIAFLFPGQGSQYVEMGRDLAVAFPAVRRWIEEADRTLAGRFERPLSGYLYPPPAFEEPARQRQQAELTETNVAQPALGTVDLALFGLLRDVGIEPAMVAGHSYGELVALCAAGCFDPSTLLAISEARGRFIREGAGEESGTMAAVEADPEALRPLLDDPEITLANMNAPDQTVISGTRAGVERALARCADLQLRARRLPVACAFHSDLVRPAQRRLAELLRQSPIGRPGMPVFSNTTADAYPPDPDAVVELLSEHLTRPVEFVRQIRAMHDAGARIFVEVGPRAVLGGLVGRILGEAPHVRVALDQPGRPGLVQLLHGLADLVAEGATVRVDRLFAGRAVRRLDLRSGRLDDGGPRLSPTTWLVDGGRARPASEPATPFRPVRVAVVDAADRPGTPARPAGPATGPAANGTHADASSAVNRPLNGYEVTMAETSSNSTNGIDAARSSYLDAPAANGAHGRPARNGTAAHAPPEPAVLGEVLAAPSPAGPLADGRQAADVIGQFQQVMQLFLQTQSTVMVTYLQAQAGLAATTPRPPLIGAGPGPAAVGAAPNGAAFPLSTAPSVPTVLSAPTVGGPMTPAPAVPAPAPSRAATPSPAPAATTGPGDAAEPTRAATAPPREGAPGVPAALDREQILQRLLAVVSDRTGYPPEMLTLDADLEADLGIDSIKRVEIAGTIVRALPLGPDVTPNMDELSASRTLGQVVDALVALADSGARPTAAAGSGRADAPSPDGARPFERPADSRIGRFVLAWGSAPIDGPSADISRDGVVVIVGEAAGAAARLAELLVRRHHRVVRLLHAERGADDRARTAPADGWLADLASPEAVARLAGAIREQHGAVAALVSLAALDRADPDGQSGVGGRSDADLTSLFLLVQAFQADLVRAAAQGGAAVLAATALGGTFAIEPVRRAPVPASGGASGLLKTLALESPAIRVKAVDLDDPRSDDVAATLLAELLAADGLVEVGYRDRQRGAPVLVPAPTGGRDGAPPLDADSVVLVTGGARGITAEAALALAQQAPGLRLVVVGRTAEPDRPEPAATADLRGPRELKGAIAEQLRRDGRVPRPATIEAAYRRLLAEREVRANLARLREAGAQVEYRACDVRDTGAFGDLIDGLYREQARIDGVIHGAGVIEDHLIRDKRLESFERVLATKAGSARVLAEKLRPERLRFLAFFGSVSGRFGNRGQGDYAAASEVLNKLAQDLDRRWPGRVVSINWGPWLSGGMVTPEVQQQFAARGVELIPVDVGCQFLADELRFGRKGEAEVIIGGASGLPAGTVTADGRAGGPTSPARSAPVDDDTASAVALPSLPLLTTGRAAGFRRDGRFELARVVGRADDAYLDDHRLDGQPVLPFAMALELMLEAAAAAEPGLAVVGVHRMRLLRGIVLDGGPRALRVVATRPTDGTTTSGHRADAPPPAHRLLSLAIVADAEPRHVHYRAEVELGARTGPLAADIPPLADGGPPPITVAEAYRAWLFHGPRFQAIAAIGAVGPGGARATLRTSLPSACLGAGAAGRWLLDPVAVDAALQVNVIWARHHWGATLLPTGFETLRIAAPLAEDGAARSADPAPIRHELRIRPESQAPVCRTDHYFAAADGRVLAVLTGMEGIGSAALNRLAGGSTR